MIFKGMYLKAKEDTNLRIIKIYLPLNDNSNFEFEEEVKIMESL